ncbi:MAG: efflux RND transporter periplasmic adaptor subunit [Burkholderiales bacterium]|nr:efflux RND transporter periplasmic adaptor subunit [Burkholderiales bacterium]
MSAPRRIARGVAQEDVPGWSGRQAVPADAVLHTLVVLVAAAGLALVPAGAPEAHEGHDHGDAPAVAPAPGSGAPRRLPDGSLFLPKPSQRLVGVRTVVATEGEQSRSVELPGLVAIEPDAAGRVQSTVPGRIEPGPRGLPSVGQKVARGQLLAIVRPSIDPVARSNQAATLAGLQAARTLAAARLERLSGLADTVPRKEIDAAASELASLDGRIRAVSGGLGAAEPLLSPVAGVVARADAVAGQVVDARELLFEIVDPTRLRIEATGSDMALAAQVVDASVAVGGRAVPLAFVGAGRMLREQTVPLVFRARGPGLAALAVGPPVARTVRLSGTARGVALPASALVRNASNEQVVWVKTAPERFEPRRVRVEPLDASRVRVVDGLGGGERVVTDGAPLLGQFR